jgi:hypothetical protein
LRTYAQWGSRHGPRVCPPSTSPREGHASVAALSKLQAEERRPLYGTVGGGDRWSASQGSSQSSISSFLSCSIPPSLTVAGEPGLSELLASLLSDWFERASSGTSSLQSRWEIRALMKTSSLVLTAVDFRPFCPSAHQQVGSSRVDRQRAYLWRMYLGCGRGLLGVPTSFPLFYHQRSASSV